MDFQRNEQFEQVLLDQINDTMYDGDRQQPSVSGMLYCITKTWYENNLVMPDSQGRKIPTRSKSTILLFVTGLRLEHILLGDTQVSEYGVTDGIQWHVDHFSNGILGEVKSTRARADKDYLKPYTSEGWIKQILAYCKVKNVTHGWLAILHLFGTGNPPFPDFLVWDFTATQQEIDDNWNWIKQRADVYNQSMVDMLPPTPFKYNMEWECRDCNWKTLCETNKRLNVS